MKAGTCKSNFAGPKVSTTGCQRWRTIWYIVRLTSSSRLLQSPRWPPRRRRPLFPLSLWAWEVIRLRLVSSRSLNRPDNNVTGISILSVPLAVKRLEMLSEMVPAATTFGFLTNPKNPNSEVTLREMPTAAAALGRNLLVVKASDDADLEVAFSTLIAQRVGALLVDADPFFFTSRDRLVALALHHDLPASYEYRDYVLLGGLMSYAADASNTYHQAGIYTGKVLSGEKPADLPVTQPTKYQLVINLKTAKALGLVVPLPLIGRTDEVIE